MTPATTLLRQVHPQFLSDGELTSQAFFPFPKDDGKLSVYDSDQITVEEAFRHYTLVLKNASHSVWGIACIEVSAIGLTSEADPKPNFPSHAVVNFGQRSEKECRKLAKKLKMFALQRGCLFQPPA